MEDWPTLSGQLLPRARADGSSLGLSPLEGIFALSVSEKDTDTWSY